jgi:hypothetical protein
MAPKLTLSRTSVKVGFWTHPDKLADAVAELSGDLEAEIYWCLYGYILNTDKLSHQNRLEAFDALDDLFDKED